MTVPARPAGLQAIIVYKFGKALFSGALAAMALTFLRAGAEASAATLAQELLSHSTREWALKTATVIVKLGTPRRVSILAVGALADAVVSLLEAYSLQSGRWWGPWLVVAATGALLPWELAEVLHRPGWVRLIVFLINLAVVAYLLRKARRDSLEQEERERIAARLLAQARRQATDEGQLRDR